MKNDRVGDWLWEEWDGEGYEPSDHDKDIFYCTYEWVDVSNDLVKRALASCLQRDGVADSLAEGFSLIENGSVSKIYAGLLDGEKVLIICNEFGETEFGDLVKTLYSVTLVEM